MTHHDIRSHPDTQCGNTEAVALAGAVTMGEVEVGVEHNTATAILTLTGPSTVWYGVGWGAAAMKDLPYAIIVDGAGRVTERRLADHGPGTQLMTSLRVEANTVRDGRRTVVVSRPVRGATKEHFTFPTLPGDLAIISAVGDTAQLAYHKAKTGAVVTLLPTRAAACVCPATQTHYISYMDEVTLQFGEYSCEDRPRSDMARYGEAAAGGRAGPNLACHSATYHGGLQCCRHGWLLTDRGQDEAVPRDKVDTYYLKWRYYFQVQYSTVHST